MNFNRPITFLFLLCFAFAVLACKKEPPVVPLLPLPSEPDTTSHTFSWTPYKFNDLGGTSYFADVAVENDTDVWAVGEVLSAPDTSYNVAHWDGRNWDLGNISVSFRGNTVSPLLDGVLVFSPTDIWVVGDLPIHGDGKNWSVYDLRSMPGFDSVSLLKAWGTSSHSIYFVGEAGSIVYFDGTSWKNQSVSSSIYLRDVWGSPDGKTVWACGYSIDQSQSILLKYDGTSWQTIWSRQNQSTPPYGDLVSSVWAVDSVYIASNWGIFRDILSDGAHGTKLPPSPQHFPYRIRGTGDNNIVEAGDNGDVWHYNGADWREVNAPVPTQVFYSVACQGNLVIAVGTDNAVFPGQAVIYMGRH